MILSILLLGFADPGFIIAALAILLLFGGKKIPELMKGISEFKKGKNEVEDELDNKED